MIAENNSRLYRAYRMKETLRLLLKIKDVREAETELNRWLWWASHSRIIAFKELYKAYEQVSIETVDGEDKNEIINGQSVTIQGSHTIITVSDDQMIQICKAVETLRKKITEAL